MVVKKPRVRIAPSPTGFAHVGTAYAALFNYAFAKKHNGKFIIRLEDTDVKRNIKGAEIAIYESLEWLGLKWDEGPDKEGKYGPYKQSERLNIYKKEVQKLLDNKMAYEDEGAIRFNNPAKDISWKDLIRGDVKFPGDQITDFVIIKSDGYPTYNFAVMVDDSLMQISHVIRGEEHISNTPRQIALYKAFSKEIPYFAHLPTLRNKQRKKLSKRRDPVDLKYYQDQGILPKALINFLCLLGWSHPEQKEIFDINEFIKLFEIEKVRKAGPIFNTDKLDWINGEYIRALTDRDFFEELKVFYKGKFEEGLTKEIIPLVKERISKLSEFESLAGFFFEVPKVDKKLLGRKYEDHLKQALEAVNKIDVWSKGEVDEKLLGVVNEKKFKTGEFFMDLRVAITGKKVTPPINDSIFILGKEEVIKRLTKIV